MMQYGGSWAEANNSLLWGTYIIGIIRHNADQAAILLIWISFDNSMDK